LITVRNRRHVDPACGYICGDQNAQASVAHRVQGAVRGALLHVTVQRRGGKAGSGQRSASASASRLVAVKHKSLIHAQIAQQVIEQPTFVGEIIDEMDALLDVSCRAEAPTDANQQCITCDFQTGLRLRHPGR
jgi:hypothetical protein